MAATDLAQRLARALDDHRPPGVEDVLIRTGVDSSGHPAVWILLVLKDESPTRGTLEQLEEWAVSTATELAAEPWPYVAFRTKSEQAEVVREGRGS